MNTLLCPTRSPQREPLHLRWTRMIFNSFFPPPTPLAQKKAECSVHPRAHWGEDAAPVTHL